MGVLELDGNDFTYTDSAFVDYRGKVLWLFAYTMVNGDEKADAYVVDKGLSTFDGATPKWLITVEKAEDDPLPLIGAAAAFGMEALLELLDGSERGSGEMDETAEETDHGR